MAALFALALCLCLFIGVVPVEADAATAKCGHNVDLVVRYPSKPATCTEAGVKYEYFECRICGKTYADAACTQEVDVGARYLIPATGHKWESEHDATYHWEKCANDGCTATQNKAKHTAGDWIQTEAGHKKVCTVCEVTIPGTESVHNGIDVDNGDGKTHRVECKDCGYVIKASVNHELKYKDNGDGTHTVTCKWCGYEEALEHVDINKNCTCDKCDALLHDYSIIVPKDGVNEHIKACSVCRRYDPTAVSEPCKFVYTPSDVKGNKSTHVWECEVCGRGKGGTVAEYCVDGNHDCICDLCKGPMFHDWDTMAGVFFDKKNATCEEDGNLLHAQCKYCRKYFLPNGQIVTKEETVLEALGHDWDDAMKSNTKYHYYKCTRVDEYGSPICKELKDKEEHVFDKIVDNKNGTHTLYCSVCNRKGETVTCTDAFGDGKCECVCGYVFPHVLESDHVHLVEAKVNTCTEDGNIAHYRCDECGGTFKYANGKLIPIADVTIKATGHKLVINETRGNLHDVTCVQVNKVQKSDGKFAKYTCDYKNYLGHEDTNGDCRCDLAEANGTVCGALLHTHSHKFQPAVEATCTTQGYEAYYYYAPCGRMFSDDTFTQEIKAPVSTGYADCKPGAWVNEGDNHVSRCENCNKVVDSGAHVDANGDNRCDVCNFELALEYVAEVPATCTTSGTKAHYISKVTQRKYWDAEGTKYISNASDLVIKAYAHIDPVTGVGPIASDKGDGTHEYVCLLCDRVTKTEAHTTGGCFCTVCGAGASADHVATTYPYQAPVCDKDGHEAYAKCSCGKYYNALGEQTTYQALVLKATGHKWGAEVFNDDAAGKHYAVCEICNAKNYGEHEVTAMDPLSGNYHQFVCECGEVTLEKHYDKDGDNVCDEEGCKRDLSNKEVVVNDNPSTTVVTGDKNNTNSAWSWLKNWLSNTTPSNGGGSTTPTQTAQPGVGTGSQGSTSTGSATTPATGSNTGSTGAGSSNATSTPSNQGGNQTAEATGVLQAIISFFNWIISGFGG